MKTADQRTADKALGMLLIAQQRMARDYPFHARFIAAWYLQETHVVRTIGVTVKGGTIVLLFNPAFVVHCSLTQLVGVLHHETLHLLFEHLWMSPLRFPDSRALTVAQEVTANEFIPEPLPGLPILLSKFPQLPPHEDTIARYRRLALEGLATDLYHKSALMDRNPPSSGPNSPSMGPKRLRPSTIPDAPETLDDHQVWEEARRLDP